jgi:ribosomal protein S18 acetylase RimI-like enzyme
MTFTLQPASVHAIADIADLLTRSFEGYFVPININEAALHVMIRRDGVDLSESRVILRDDELIGVALIARRGWTSRLAAMGIVFDARHGGAGKWTMEQLIREARARHERQMVLEVIEQNTAGMKLYEGFGFRRVRRLVGYQIEKPAADSRETLKEMDIRELAKLITAHGLVDLPWQLSGESIAQHTPPSRAFRLNDACCLISNPEAEHVVIWSVLVKAGSRGAGLSPLLLRTVFSQFPGKTWHVPALYPEEMSPIFDELGMKRDDISQLQMSLRL